jgi:lysozyme
MRKVNKAGIDLIKSFEGLKLKPYLDAVNVATIGYGTIEYPNGKRVTVNDPAITEEEAEQLLMHEVNKKAEAVEKLVKVQINDNEFAALVSFAYNLGVGNLSKSTLLKCLNSHEDRQKLAEEFLKWNKAGGKVLAGLTRRRQAEKALFLHPVKERLPNEPSEEDINVTLSEIENRVLGK